MTTEQKYVGKGSHANPIDSTVGTPPLVAQNAAKKTPTPDEWQGKKTSPSIGSDESRLMAHYEHQLAEESELLRREANAFNSRVDGIGDVTRALTTVLGHWITTEYIKIARSADEEEMAYYNKVVFGVLDSLEFITIVSDRSSEAVAVSANIQELQNRRGGVS